MAKGKRYGYQKSPGLVAIKERMKKRKKYHDLYYKELDRGYPKKKAKRFAKRSYIDWRISKEFK